MSANVCFGAVLLVTVLIIAFMAWRKLGRRVCANFTPRRAALDLPAVPRAIDAMGALLGALERVGAAECAASAQAGIAPLPLTGALADAAHRIRETPPTYANYSALYYALAGLDVPVKSAADAFAASGNLALVQLSCALKRVPAAVHRLGAALDEE